MFYPILQAETLQKKRKKKKVIKKEAKALFFMHTNKQLYHFQTGTEWEHYILGTDGFISSSCNNSHNLLIVFQADLV